MINPKVAIILVNYNSQQDTLECLESLFRISYPNFKVVLVDNNSKDDSAKIIRQRFGAKVKIIENSKNLGFAEGNNVGVRWALKNNADYVMLLNNDTIVNPSFLDILIKNVQNKPQFEVFSPQIRMYPDKNRLWYAGGRMMPFLGSVQMFNRGAKISNAKLKKPSEITFITGAAMLISALLFKKVGFLDKKYFLYWEETDWEARALRAGVKFLYVPDAVIWHKISQSTGGAANPKMQYYFYRNNLLFAKKNLVFYWWPTFLLFIFFRILFFEIGLGLIQYLFGKRTRFLGLKYLCRGILDFFSGKFGATKLE